MRNITQDEKKVLQFTEGVSGTAGGSFGEGLAGRRVTGGAL